MDIKKQPYYKYLSERTKNIFDRLYPETDVEQQKQLQQQQFAKTYLPPLKSRVTGDIRSILKFWKIPGGLWNQLVETPVKEAVSTEHGGFWNPNKSVAEQFWEKPTWSQVLTGFKNLGKAMIKPPILDLPYTEKIPAFNKLEKKLGLQDTTAMGADYANKLLLDSMIKNTGSFVYDPESKGRRWFPKPSEGARYQQYKEHPVLSAFEDIVNLSLVAAPILKATGAGTKLLKIPAVEKLTTLAKESSIGQNLLKFSERLGQRAKFGEMFSNYRKKQFSAIEGITGKNKFVKAFANIPDDVSNTLFKVTEGTADWTDDIARIAYKEAQNKGYKLTYNTFKNYADNALDVIRKDRIPETNWLVREGFITADQASNRAWMPAIKKHLIDSGKYTLNELDDLLTKNKGFAKDLLDEYKIASAETMQMFKEMGIDAPVQMPHMWEKYMTGSDFYGKQPLYKYTPSFLKKAVGYGGYLKEPVTVLTRHKVQFLKWKQATSIINETIKRFGRETGEGILTGYREYFPEGFLKYVYTKNPLLKAGRKIQLPDFMVGELNKVFNAPGAFEKFLRATYDPATKVWKTSVLALSPRWVFNNFFGNMALNMAGGVNPFAYWETAKKFKKASELAKKTGWSKTKALRKLGIPEEVSRGLYSAEARSAGAGLARFSEASPIQNMFGKALNYTGLPQIARGMYKFNSGIESFFRTAHYLDKIGKKGFNVALATKSVNEFLFDYSNLSALEKNVFRRILPFYSWQKNITRLVVTYPFKYPLRTAILQKVNALVKEPEEMDYRFLPEYMMDYVPTPLKVAGEKLYLSTRGVNPFADVGINLSNINPMLKLIIERSTGMNLFKGRQFTSPERTYASTEKIVPPLWKHIASQFPQYQLYQNLRYPYSKYDTGEPMLSTKTGEPINERNPLLDALKIFGINLTALDMEQMTQQGIEKAMSKQKQIEKYNKLLEQYKSK